jgi:hypothetical protein
MSAWQQQTHLKAGSMIFMQPEKAIAQLLV